MALLVLIGIGIAVLGVVLIVQGVQGRQGNLRTLGGTAVVVGVLVTLLSSAFVVVPAGNVGVVFNVFGGVQDGELGEGFHIVLPFLQQVTLYDIRQQELTLSSSTGDQISSRSSEGLEISVDATILYQVAPTEVARLHQDIGPSYEQVRVRPEVRSQIRDSIAQFEAASLISTERTQVAQLIETALRDCAVDGQRAGAVGVASRRAYSPVDHQCDRGEAGGRAAGPGRREPPAAGRNQRPNGWSSRPKGSATPR